MTTKERLLFDALMQIAKSQHENMQLARRIAREAIDKVRSK